MWLLPYHSDVRTKELIRLDMKHWVGTNNTRLTMHTNNTKHFCEQRFKQTGQDRHHCQEGIIEDKIESVVEPQSVVSEEVTESKQ